MINRMNRDNKVTPTHACDRQDAPLNGSGRVRVHVRRVEKTRDRTEQTHDTPARSSDERRARDTALYEYIVDPGGAGSRREERDPHPARRGSQTTAHTE